MSVGGPSFNWEQEAKEHTEWEIPILELNSRGKWVESRRVNFQTLQCEVNEGKLEDEQILMIYASLVRSGLGYKHPYIAFLAETKVLPLMHAGRRVFASGK